MPDVMDDWKKVPANIRGLAKDHFRKLASEGCRVAGYSLSGDEPWPKLCSKHIDNGWRVIVAFQDDNSIVVMKVALHNDERDPYAEIAAELKIPISTAPRTKPQCCEDGVPRTLDQEILDGLEQSFRHLRGV
jgi:mRNA-degrading endonuclease RelE of RelBE toxin-antitoxin system